jgi:TrmH family RNA methyltransferase
LRATAGSIFRLPFIEACSIADFVGDSQEAGLQLFALTAAGGTDLACVDFKGASAIIAGSEGHGISKSLLAGATAVSIPTNAVESLNAAVAASIALFRAYQQRGCA